MPESTPSASDAIVTRNASTVRATQFAQQVRMTSNAPAQIAQMTERAEQSRANLKKQILSPEIKAILGADYEAVKAEVEAL